ncbi:MAG: hypothetical protein J6Z02_00925 [Lachnospiraceae bacterium]|nr:hypothetical protein [Lachnospiraceae bacterium]
MTKQIEYLFDVIRKELAKQNISLHSLVEEDVLSYGEYNYIKSQVKNEVDFVPKYDFAVRMCDVLNITPNDLVEGMEGYDDYLTPVEDAFVNAVKSLNETEAFQINMLMQMELYGLKKLDEKEKK